MIKFPGSATTLSQPAKISQCRNKYQRSGNVTSTTRIKSAEAQLDKRIHEFWAVDIAENISTIRNHLLNCKLSGEIVLSSMHDVLIVLSSLSSMHDVLMLIQFTKSKQCPRTRRYDG